MRVFTSSASPRPPVSPEGFVEMVLESGFVLALTQKKTGTQVQLIYRPTTVWFHKYRSRMESQGRQLLRDVPQTLRSRASFDYNNNGQVLVFKLRNVAPDFVAAIKADFEMRRGGPETERRRKDLLNQGFDQKVAEEIITEPAVVAIDLELSALQARADRLGVERQAKLETLRVEREPLRESYLYVSDEREL
jgi:hypothetical protein